MKNPVEFVLEKALESDFAGSLAGRMDGLSDGAVYAAGPLVPLLAAVAYLKSGGPLVLAVSGDAAGTAADLECLIPGEALHLPGAGPLGDSFHQHDDGAGRRLKAARALSRGKVAVVGVEALIGGIPAGPGEAWPVVINEGVEIGLGRLMNLLVEGGYRREYTVEGWGRFALRGGILDVFPSTAERPVRIEFSGDRVESLREFNVVTQSSSARLEGLELFPAEDPGDDPRPRGKLVGARVLAVDPGLIEARAAEFLAEAGLEPRPGPVLPEWGAVIPVETMGRERAGEKGGPVFPGAPAREFAGDLQSAVREWKKLLDAGNEVFLLLEGRGQVDHARELWDAEGGGPRAPVMGVGTLRRGFSIPDVKVALFTSGDLLGRRERKRPTRRASSGTPVASYAELEVGRYAVHSDQGIGVYRGLVSREALGVTREYLLLEYAEGDRLYVPTTQLSKVQRYIGSEDPTVHRLRGGEWARARKRARRSAEKTARGLIQLYMERKTGKGYAFSPDTPWQRELEDSFEYEETPDQARAVRDVKGDMEAQTSMDRLVCGDVGYGKTEVAVRAAMKAAMDSKQVAVLVPTTVLAKQHYETFTERLAPFPIKVEMLSRFLDRREQEEVVGRLRSGAVDVVVGTHRILQDDVSFKGLGLLLVDEEQKFGVMHKEKLRMLRRNVDTLTLTATPIPRTLQMSLSGVRDVSIIDTPPEDRHPIATYVGEADPELVRRAAGYEIARGGQVFYVHNRIGSIERVAHLLKEAMPEASVAVAHGRMDEDDLERVMLEFAEGMHDVLVCTTIIESGLDLPNVNTLIVDRADRLGLAQLYQIRGRVGRSGRRAYAYFFYPHRAVLTGNAVARLATISEMTPLGSGMRVAMRDLEIRGAGNLLGAEQSGQIEAVGFELYCQLLKEAVDILKGESLPPERESAVELPVDAYVPAEYISDEEARVEIYRRLVVAGRTGTVSELARELADRFGEPPTPVERLMELEGIRLKAGEAGVEAVTMKGAELQLKFFPGEESLIEAASVRALKAVEAVENTYSDPPARTLYLKLRFEGVKNRQELLLKWLNSIIDDIIKVRLCDGQGRQSVQ